MKKTVNINLGGHPFTIDEDAYSKFDLYLATIENHFSQSEGCEDIMSDIEYRICELFQENLRGGQIITMKTLDSVIAIMGKPEDFGAEAIDSKDEWDSSKSKHSQKVLLKPGKRLFRDPDNAMIGGVASGLTAYLGLHNTTAVRIFWLAFGFTFIGFVLYLVLWALLPEAVTASDKLAMRGEPVNVENIAKTIEEELEDFSQKITEFSNSFNKERKKRKNKKDESSSMDYDSKFTY